MIVVFDTTVLFPDLFAEGLNWTLLRDFRNNRNVSLVVPQIVLEEAINHFRLELTKEEQTARKALTDLADRLRREEPWRFAPIDIAKETAAYETAIKNRLESLGVRFAAYDTVSLKSLVDRALLRQKPFDAGGKVGFRDAIIWETVLGLLKEQESELVLVTKNKNDFGAEQLPPDLEANLKAVGVPSERVSVIPDLKTLIDKFVTPTLKQVEELRLAIERGDSAEFNAAEYFQDQYDAFVNLVEEHLDPLGLDFGPRSKFIFRNPQIARLDALPSSIEVDSVFQIEPSRVMVDLTYWFGADVTCERFRRIGTDTVVTDGAFTGSVNFDCPVTVEVDLETGDASEFENNTFGWSFGPEWSGE